MDKAMSFFETRQKTLGILAALYVLFLLLSHWQLSSAHVWIIAAVFSILMNFTYMIEAFSLQSFLRKEIVIAAILITLSFLGALLYPPLVIAAIFGHGVWDISKHRGAGVPFFSWYTLGCAAVDFTYSALLLIYYLR